MPNTMPNSRYGKQRLPVGKDQNQGDDASWSSPPEESGLPLRNEILTILDVAFRLRCSKAHVSHLIHGAVAGVSQLPCLTLGRRKLVRGEWLEEWIELNKRQC